MIRRFAYPQNASKWRRGKGLGKCLSDMYDWIENRKETPDEVIEEDEFYEDEEIGE